MAPRDGGELFGQGKPGFNASYCRLWDYPYCNTSDFLSLKDQLGHSLTGQKMEVWPALVGVIICRSGVRPSRGHRIDRAGHPESTDGLTVGAIYWDGNPELFPGLENKFYKKISLPAPEKKTHLADARHKTS